MRKKRVCYYIGIFFYFLWTSFTFSKIDYKNQEIIFKKLFESKNAFISYININNQNYIVKQKKDKSKVVIAVIREALAAYIAQDFNIAHCVEIIAMQDIIPGKIYKNLPATLHTIAPGKMIRELIGKYAQLCIKQRGSKRTHRWFNEVIIEQITWHKDLPIIVALDIFLCNTDRHQGNLFYDEIKDSFCAIDMDNIYRRNLPIYASENIKKMIKNKKKFTKNEIEALKLVKKTMEFLLQKYSLDNLIALLHTFAYQAGYRDDGSLESNRIKRIIKLHEEIIKESYISMHGFVRILDRVINNFEYAITASR